ncbi:MAG: beta-lactamase family protein [Clostridia bacterium]|nr:beta-lactamase family protein [Clostridia bacterium]
MSRFLEACADYIRTTQPFDIIRLAEIKDGGEIETYEYTKANPCQDVYSVAKAHTMTAIGLLYDRGLIRMDERVCDIMRPLLPADGMDERWQDVTVEMVLKHRAGLPVGHLDIDCNPASLFGYDYLNYLFRTPLVYDPDAEERYSDGAYYLLARIAEQKTGIPMDNFLWRELYYPLGYQEAAWSRCPMGHPMGATGLYIRADDMAKLGLVYLDGGLYRGVRVLSEEWTALAVEKEYTFEWDPEHKIYFKGGMSGQKLIVAPEQNRVVALQAFGANSNVIADFVKNYKD